MSKQIKNIGLIGNGSWGTALAKLLTENGAKATWWIRNKEAVEHLIHHNQNPHYLQSVKFASGSIFPTNELSDVFEQCDTIVFCVPAAYAQDVLSKFTKTLLEGKLIVSAIKGLLPFTNQLLNDYLEDTFGFSQDDYVSITGPCHAEEVAAERLSYLTFSCLNIERAQNVASLFRNANLRTTCNHDIWGAQLASVLKNIYALGAGIAHALDYGDNFMSVYITNCYREMYHFLQQHFDLVHPSDCRPDFHTSAYLGDLLVTGYSLFSRNRRFGVMIGKGYSVEATILEMNMVAEGYYAAKCMKYVAEKYNIKLDIAEHIYSILWEHRNADKVFSKLEDLLS